MSHDFVYGVQMNLTLACALEAAQLNHEPDMTQGFRYKLSPLLADDVVIARNFPDGYAPLMVGLCFLEQVDGRFYFNAYQIPNGKLTIVPQVHIDLADSQFNDLTGDVCLGRTVKGAVFAALTNEEITELNDANAFSVVDNTLVFGFALDTVSKEKTGDRQAFEVHGHSQALGRVSMEEVMDDSDVYDELSIKYLARLSEKG